ncbi:hypothetical protein AB0H73_06685 [Streptomyces olivoreticuli]
MRLTKAVQARALRLVQALITATQSRGHGNRAGATHGAPPAARLRIIVSGGQPHRASEWADTADRSLEDQLAEIVQEVDLRGEAAERKRLADLEAAKQKRLLWEAAMRQARAEYAEAYRMKHLESQEEAWRRATRLAEYLSAARRQVEPCRTGRQKMKPKPGSHGPIRTWSG